MGEAVRDGALPAGCGDQEIADRGASGAPAGRSEHIAPHVEHRQQVVAAVGIWSGNHQGLGGEVQPGDGIEGIEIRTHHALEIGWRVFGHADEHVHRPLAECLARFNVGELLAGDVHRQHRVEIDIGIDPDGRGLFAGHWRGRCGECSHNGECAGGSLQCIDHFSMPRQGWAEQPVHAGLA
ncbi:hypothetical protein D9M71_415110 [compost metagenome]